MAAEAEIELGNLAKGQEYINRVRTRAKNTAGFVPTAPASPFNPRAPINYQIEVYTPISAELRQVIKSVDIARCRTAIAMAALPAKQSSADGS